MIYIYNRFSQSTDTSCEAFAPIFKGILRMNVEFKADNIYIYI